MENYVGLAAVFAAFIFSKKDRRIPLTITLYYVAYLLLWNGSIGGVSAFEKVIMSHAKAAAWYLLFTALNTLVIISLLTFCKRTLIVKFYALIIMLSSIYNTAGLFFSALSMDWYSDIYLLHQRYAIQLDILIAWLASDNVISRKLNGALKHDASHTTEKGLEHGKPN